MPTLCVASKSLGLYFLWLQRVSDEYEISLCFCLWNSSRLSEMPASCTWILLWLEILGDVLVTNYLGSSTQYETPSADLQEIKIHTALRRNCVGVSL